MGHAVNGLLEGLKALGPIRLAAMAAVAAGMLGLFAVLTLHGGADRMALLYGDLDMREAAQINDLLDHQHIAHEIGAGGTEVLVAADQVARARLLLARENLPSGGSIGYELFDKSDGLTANQFQQQLNQARALEGELSRTIRSISGVRAARVHLVLPRREPFARDRQDAQASVVLTMTGPARLDHEGIQAILNLVAAAVPGLRPQNIAVIDSRGNLLARAGEPLGSAAVSGVEELRRATEQRLSRAVEEMLERSLGPGRVRAEAAVEMDFDQTHETTEKFDPDGQVTRSTQTVNGNSRSTEANPAVTVQNNLPNADAGAPPGAGSQEQRQEETTNYEIGKTVRTIVREQPQIKRISLAVLVDGTDERRADGTSDWKPRPPEELATIERLVRSAIGFDEKRGDHVDVVNMRFVADSEPTTQEPRGILGVTFEKSDVMRLAQTALIGVLGILALLFVLRPMVVRLAANAPASLLESSAAAETLGPGGVAALAGPGGVALTDASGRPIATPGGAGAMAGPSQGVAGLLEDESMVNVANIEGQMRASSIRRIAELADRHPDETLSIMRAWIHQEAN